MFIKSKNKSQPNIEIKLIIMHNKMFSFACKEKLL